MRDGRRPRLAAACGSAAVACAAAPLLPWLSATSDRTGHCGWTCRRPPVDAPNVALLTGRGGPQVVPVLSALLVVLAVLLTTLVVLVVLRRTPPVLLGRTLAVAAFVALIGTVLAIVRYAEGGTLVRTEADGLFVADPGAGAVVALVASSAALLLGGGVALRAPWASATTTRAEDAARARRDDARSYPCSSRS